FLQRYVQKETESMQSSKANITAATLATRQKKMAEICSLIKYFIRYANKRGPRLKCSELLRHVTEVLQSAYSCAAYGEDYSSLLLKDILSVRKYWCDIAPQQWHSLLELYCGFFNSSSKSINRALVSRVIHVLVQGCCTQTDGPTHGQTDGLFGFFSRAFQNTRQEKHAQTVLEHLVSALNIFLRSAAMNYRMRVCRLGEELLSSVLYVWAEMRPSASLKEEIVDFFQLQISVHHPQGAKTQETGASAEDWPRWRCMLYSLYDALVSEISHIGSRGRLQITAVLTSKHPSMVPSQQLLALLSVLCQLLGEQRRGERGPYVLRCLREVARCQALCPQRAQVHKQELGRLWGRVWALALRSVSSPQTEALSLDLLASIVHGGLISMDREFWKLFSGSACKPTKSAALCLARALLTCPVPRRLILSSGWDHVGAADGSGSPNLKEILIGWLLMSDQSDETEDSSRPHPIISRDFPHSLIANILVSLSLKDTRAGLKFLLGAEGGEGLLTGVLAGYVSTGLVTEEEACHSQLFTKAKALAQDFGDFVSSTKVKLSEEGTMATLRSVMNWCTLSATRTYKPVRGQLFKPQDVLRRLLLLVKQIDLNIALHLNMDQEICAAVLLGLLPSIRSLGTTRHTPEEMRHVQGVPAPSGVGLLRGVLTEDKWDETFNRKVTLLKTLSAVLCCSPVCEKQSLFALFQSYKENDVEEPLIKKMLCSVSKVLGYKSVKTFISSHLYYLVAEWLSQRQSDDRYTLGSFPYTLLDHDTIRDFYNSSYQVLIPHLVFLDDFEQVKSIGRCLERDWRELLADCFPKIMVNILPYFALCGPDAEVAQQREKAHRVYDLLKDANCLGKQQIDSLIHSNLADIVVELLMTLYEGNGAQGDLKRFIGELDPVPNPPYFSSYVIKATLDYLSKCHSANHKSLVAILSKTPISIQRILLAVCERVEETTNSYERHRILLMYHLFVSLLLQEVKDGLGGAWAFVLRDIIYTLIHHINSRPLPCDEVSDQSLSLCLDLLTSVCQAALQHCGDALDCHLQVITGTLTAQVTSRPAISQQVLTLLQFLVIENQQKLREAICRLEPFPDLPEFRELRSVQHMLKYNGSTFTLRQEISHFLSVTSCDSLPLTRLEGLKELTRQLHDNMGEIRELLRECQADPTDSVLVKLVLDLLQLCKLAVNHPAAADVLEAAGSCLGELGPVNFSTIALLRGRDPLYEKAVLLFTSTESQRLYIILNCMNDALTQQRIDVRRAAAQCVENILGTQSGVDFWHQHKDNGDPMLAYLNPFRKARKKVAVVNAKESSQAREQLESQELWIPQVGGHKGWLKALCSALLDGGGVKRSDTASPGLYDKASLRTMLAVLDYLRHQKRPLEANSSSSGTVCESNFWLELNYLEVAKAAQSCSAHFTALLYTEIYVDKVKANMEESHRSVIHDRSCELLIEVYCSIGEPDSLYGCGGETMTSPLTRIRTYEHEAMWGKALTSYDLHSTLAEVTRQVGIVEGLQNFGLNSILTTYMRGLESQGVEWGAELRELRFQAAWRNTQWDCELSERSDRSTPGIHELLFCGLQALRDKEFLMFDETVKQARATEVEELCRGSLEAVSSLYPALRNLQSIGELDSVKQLFSRPFSDLSLRDVCSQWRQHSHLLGDSDFSLVEPILALRSVAQNTLMSRVGDPDSSQYLSSVLTEHLMELCRLARKAGNTQLAERAVFQMKQHRGGTSPVSTWHLEEAQVFWAMGEQGLALGLLRHMIHHLEGKVDFNPALSPVYAESLRLCGNWLAETCLESPGVILEKYLERAMEVIECELGAHDIRLRTEAFLSLARFTDAQYQSIDKYMKSSEFENKQALLEKAKEEVGLIKQCKVTSNRYTIKVERELLLDEKALSNLRADRQRFLCKAVENYIQCLEDGETHDTWVFRLASLWLENADVKTGQRHDEAARMGTKMASAEDVGFHDVLIDLICRSSLEHPHHTLFIIFALVNANKDENFSRSRLWKNTPRQLSPFDLDRTEVARKIISTIRKTRGELIRGMELLSDAYITLAYMDVSRHKTEKSESLLLSRVARH
ncbi:unnamed protein product, partial [Lampetra planeri]